MTHNGTPQTNPSSNHHPDMPPNPGAEPSRTSGRAANGRFGKGNPGGPGNPFARQVAAFRQEFMAATTTQDIAAIARAMIDKAKEGDCAAARIVLQYTLGKPAATVDPDRLDEMEWEQWQRENVCTDSDKVWMGMNASSANAIARAVVPIMQKEHFAEIKREMDERAEDDCEDNDWDERDEQQDEAEARRPEPAEAAQEPAQKGRRTVSSLKEKAETPKSVEPSASVSPVVEQEADEGSQSASADDPMTSAERLLRLLAATVSKRGETVRRAANEFDG